MSDRQLNLFDTGEPAESWPESERAERAALDKLIPCRCGAEWPLSRLIDNRRAHDRDEPCCPSCGWSGSKEEA